jgi:hypothetical protein
MPRFRSTATTVDAMIYTPIPDNMINRCAVANAKGENSTRYMIDMDIHVNPPANVSPVVFVVRTKANAIRTTPVKNKISLFLATIPP